MGDLILSGLLVRMKERHGFIFAFRFGWLAVRSRWEHTL
jgi:hypothetical protein